MNTATQNLENDHAHILRLIDVMEAMVKKPEVNLPDLEQIVELIREFADGLHHAKEEHLLFPLMTEKGFSMQHGPIAVMLMDHEQGRKYVKGMADHILLLKAGDSEAEEQIYANMLGYADLLTNHIAKENNVLFRMADNVLTVDEQLILLKQFSGIDAGSSGQPAAAEHLKTIDLLANRYLQ